MEQTEIAICHIHGGFYSGYPECPICEVMQENDDLMVSMDI